MERQGFLNFMDMIDGGGMGASGDEFKGGGLLSDIANALFQPAGYRDRMRGRQEVRPMARPASMMQPAPVQPPMPTGPAGAGGAMAGPGMPGFQPPMQPPMGPAGAGGPMAGPGMPGFQMPGDYPDWANTPEMRAIVDYMRSVGAAGF